jgi:hypothetical protein
MRQQGARSTRAWTVAAIIGAVVAFLIVMGDGLILASRANVAVPLPTDGRFPWLLLLIPVLIAGGIAIGARTPPIVGLSTIFIAIAEERFTQGVLPQGGFNLRLDEVLVPAIIIGLLLHEWTRSELRQDWMRVPGLAPLALFLLANLLPTLFVMPDLVRGLSLFTILLAGGVCYVGVAILARRVADIEAIVLPLALVGALEAVFGLGALGLGLALGRPDIFGVQIDPVTNISAPYGTMFEANFFGQFLVAILLLALAFLCQLAFQRRLRSRAAAALIGVVLLTAAGALASETRASWLGCIVGMTVLAMLWPLRGANEGVKKSSGPSSIARWLPTIAIAALLVILTVALFAIASSDSPLGQRVSSILDFNTGSGFGRLRVFGLVINDLHNPIVGMGDGSFNIALPAYPGRPPDAPWIFSMFLAVLHDSGVVGLTLWLTFLAAIYRALLRMIQGDFPRPVQTLAIAMTAVLSSLLVSGQATTGMYLIFFWVFLGVAGAVSQYPLHSKTSEVQMGPNEPDYALSRAPHLLNRILTPTAMTVHAWITSGDGSRLRARAPSAGGSRSIIPANNGKAVGSMGGMSEFLAPSMQAVTASTSALPRSLVRAAFVVAVVVPTCLVSVVLWVIWTRTASVPYGDEWFMGPIVRHADAGTLSFGELFAPFNTHRLFLQRVVDLAVIEVTGWNRQVEMTVHVAVAIGGAALILSSVRSALRSGGWWVLLVAPVSLLLVGLGQSENWVDAFNLGFIGTCFGLSLCLRALYTASEEPIGWGRFSLALCGAGIASLSNAAGLIVWVAFLPLVSRLGYRRLMIWLGAAIAVWIAYFSGNSIQSSGQSPSILNQLLYVLAYLGAPAGAYIAPISVVVGALSVVIWLATLFLYFKLNSTLTPILGWIALSLFALGTASSTMFGRAQLGLDEAMSYRYQAFSAYWWISIFVVGVMVIQLYIGKAHEHGMPLVRLPEIPHWPSGARAIVAANVLFLVLACGGSVAMNYRGLRGGLIFSDRLRSHQQCIVEYRTAPDDCLSIYLTSLAFKPLLEDTAAYMEEHHLGIFNSP